jgi:hypothetical protein
MRCSQPLNSRSREFPADAIDFERRVLRRLCRAKLTRAEWSKIVRALHEYAWLDVEHGLVYAAIERLAPHDPKGLRDQLPAQATRMGFPDIDWQVYFSANEKAGAAPGVDPIARQVTRLVESSSAASQRGSAGPKRHRRPG